MALSPSKSMTFSFSGSMSGFPELSTNTMSRSRQVVSSTDFMQANALDVTNSSIQSRMATCTGLKLEVETALTEVEAEHTLLNAQLEATTAAIRSKTAPIAAVTQWLKIRSQRPAEERIHDYVDISAEHLLATLNESVKRLGQIKAQEMTALAELDDSIATLEADLADKTDGLKVDSMTLSLMNPTMGKTIPPARKPGVTPTQWRGSSNTGNLQAKLRSQMSAQLRAKAASTEADALAKEEAVHKKLLAANAASRDALQQAINENQAKIEQCVNESNDLMAQYTENNTSLSAKEMSAQVVADRMETRNSRPGRELVYDEAQHALQTEFTRMATAANDLKKVSQRCLDADSHVNSLKKAYTHTLNNKNKCLQLETDCLLLSIM